MKKMVRQQKWYESPLRIAALQADYEKGENLKVIDKWAGMGFNVEQLKHVLDVGTNILGEFRLERHGEILREYIARAKAQHIRIILYLNVHVFPPGDTRAGKCAQRQADGSFYLNYSTYSCICTRSCWKESFFQIIESLKEFSIDGIFLDGPMIIPGGCFCDVCRAEFKNKYEYELEGADKKTIWQFNADSMSLFMHESYRRFKQIKPDGVFYNNAPALHPTASYVDLKDVLQYNDILGTEGGFFDMNKWAYNWKPGVTARTLEALAPDKPRVNFMAGNHYPLSWYMHNAAETKLCIASSVAHDCNVWYGLHGPSELLETPGGKAAGEMFRALSEKEEYYAGSESMASTAVMYSLNTERIYKATIGATDLYGKAMDKSNFAGDFAKSFMGACDMLLRSGMPFDVIADLDLSLEKLKRYECIILPTSACLADGDLELLRQYVAGGGNIIASFDTSLYTPDGECRRNFGLSDVFGVSFDGNYTDYNIWNYVQTVTGHGLLDGVEAPLMPASRTGINVKNHGNGGILARFLGALKGRYDVMQAPDKPAIVLNSFGKGNCLYFAGTFLEHFYDYNFEEYKTIVTNAVHRFSHVPVKLAGVNGNIEVVVRRQKNRILIHLINYTGPFPRPLEKLIPQKDFELIVESGKRTVKNVETLFGNEKLHFHDDGNRIIITVPVLREYEVIVLEN